MTSAYDQLRALSREAAVLNSARAVLAWDQETFMPAGGAELRADQAAALATIAHARATDPRIAGLLDECEAHAPHAADPHAPDARNLREMRRDYERAMRLPAALVAELAKVGSQAQQAWKDARERADFHAFQPWLERMLELTRRKAECWGAPQGGELYDALLEEYEPGARAEQIHALFTPLATRLSALVASLLDNGTRPDDAPVRVEIHAERQHAFGMRILEAIGFDLHAGRLDVTTHPFCEGIGPGDTRLTTRYRESRWTDALFGTLHEGGHGLYEQGLPKRERFGEPLGEAISLGIHESQSRMWENFVGRSAEFWRWAAPIAEQTLGLRGCSAEQIFRAVNTVDRSFIRVEADEATYNLHVLLRFELERALVRGDLHAADLPHAWNTRFEQLLGVRPPDDRRGCLQDVHWSFGLIGYFPTYTLGNLAAAQLWETIHTHVPGLAESIANGRFAPLLEWLRHNIHAHGRRFRAGELIERLTGQPLSPDPLLRYLTAKLAPVYNMG